MLRPHKFRLRSFTLLVALICLVGVSPFQASEPDWKTFLLPKHRTGAVDVTHQNPDWDGRGIVVAILDTGIDPAAAGMQKTSHGLPKVIDIVDATGSGDVQMEDPGEKTEDGFYHGLSGRKLEFPEDWSDAIQDLRLGLKRGYDLFPGPVVDRLKKESLSKAKKEWTTLHADLQVKWEEAENLESGTEREGLVEDYKKRWEIMKKMESEFDDPGPMFDCVTFRRDGRWFACVDTDSDGSFKDEKLMTDYRVRQDLGFFGSASMVHFGVNIYEEGKLLSLVVESGTHGTHVAGIVGAYIGPDSPLNGLAPGVQLVSVKIGDTRLDGMETGSALMRAIPAILRNECHLINMSYGEPTISPDKGRILSAFSKLVMDHNVVFVASAGNAGPALSTIGAPGGTTGKILGIGALQLPELSVSAYSKIDPAREDLFPWSSRGPTFDGDLGVDLCAPGAAMASVPLWHLEPDQLMNGTSMAAPNACGSMAVLMSALISQGIEWKSFSFSRGLQVTAEYLIGLDPWSQGKGLIRVDKALDWFEENKEKQLEQVYYSIDFVNRNHARGLYLREGSLHKSSRLEPVRIQPQFPEDVDNQVLGAFHKSLKFKSNAHWVRSPQTLWMNHRGRQIDIQVDVDGLPPGVHSASIEAFEEGDEEMGPLFSIPVTIVLPEPVKNRIEVGLKPGEVRRRFFKPQPFPSRLKVQMIGSDDQETRGRAWIHVRQCVIGLPDRSSGQRKVFNLPRGGDKVDWVFDLEPDAVVEICLASDWSGTGDWQGEWEIEFSELSLHPGELSLTASNPMRSVLIAGAKEPTTLKPVGTLDTVKRTVHTSEHTIRMLGGERDRFLDGGFPYEIVLDYPFSIPYDTRITPEFPLINQRLYDLQVTSQLWILLDGNGRHLSSGDAWPNSLHISKGEYRLKLHLRHPDRDLLGEFSKMDLVLAMELAEKVEVGVYDQPDAYMDKDLQDREIELLPGETRAVWVGAQGMKAEKNSLKAGDVLAGKVILHTELVPLYISQTYTGQVGKSKKTAIENPEQQSGLLSLEKLRLHHFLEVHEGLIDSDWEAEFEVLEGHFPKNVQLLQARLIRLDNQDRKSRLGRVVNAADQLIHALDPELLRSKKQLAEQPKDDPEDIQGSSISTATKIVMLTDALYRKGRALAFMELDPDDEESIGNLGLDHWAAEGFDLACINELFEDNFKLLRSFVDTKDPDWFRLHVRRDRRKGLHGHALELVLNTMKQGKMDEPLYDKKIRILEELGWSFWSEHWKKRKGVDFPRSEPHF